MPEKPEQAEKKTLANEELGIPELEFQGSSDIPSGRDDGCSL